MNRTQKEEKVAVLHDAFRSAPLVVVTKQDGMTVAESTDLRRRMRETGGRYRVTKNRLARLALQGTPYEGLHDLFHGPTGVAFAEDPVPLAKAIVDYAKKNQKLAILGGGLGTYAIDVEGVEALATMPPIEELRGKIVGLLQAPAGRLVGILPRPAQDLVGILPAPAAQLARVFQAYATQDKAA